MATVKTWMAGLVGGGGGGGVQEASARQVLEWMRVGACVLVDVREADEHARERIAGARLLPLSRFEPREAASSIQPGQRLVLHCKGGKRSADAARLAVAALGSRATVVSMAGGIEAWKGAGLPVQSNASTPE